jgi:hypothetical protein
MQWCQLLSGYKSETMYDAQFYLRESFFQISEIHGMPHVSWDGSPSNGVSSYCVHSTNVFSTWHRLYIVLFESDSQYHHLLYSLSLCPLSHSKNSRELLYRLQDPLIHQMNIWSVICLIPAYTNWIFSQQSTWPIHTPNEYLVNNPPDPYIHQMNIQSEIYLT